MNQEYTLEPYSPEHNAGLAVMWNESDDQWPGTWTGGVPMTTERVAQWMDEEICLLKLVVKQRNGRIVGFGNLRDQPGREGHTCYVAVLNIHPDHQGRSLCRRMLTQMVDYATDYGYERMTIGTWPANIKSVPLYKKVGFHWKPNTDVLMEDYVPGIRALPVLDGFFAESDWYQDFRRELKQEPDDQRHPQMGETKVYLYRWEHGERFVEAVVDRAAQALTGLETEAFALFARVENNEPVQGLPYEISWQITNRCRAPLPVRIYASADEGIDLDCRETYFHGRHTWTVAPGETRTIASQFVCAPAAPKIKLAGWQPKAVPGIHSRVILGNDEIPLVTGLHYHPIVEVSLHPETPVLAPGRTTELLVQLQNWLDQPLIGTLHIAGKAVLQIAEHEQSFELPARGFAGVPIAVTPCDVAGAALHVTPHVLTAGRSIDGTSETLPVLVRPPAGLVATREAEAIHVVNDFFRIKGLALAGRIKVWNHAEREQNLWFREELGPPYAPHDCEFKEYDLDLDVMPGLAVARFAVESDRFSGVRLTRELTISGSPLMRLQHRLENNGSRTHTIRVMTRIGLLDIEMEPARVAIPRQERLVLADASQFPLRDGDFPRSPDDAPEQWAAFELAGQVHGVVWPANTTDHKLEWGYTDLQAVEVKLEPGQSVTLDPVYVYCGPGTWSDVRRVWQQACGDDRALPTTGNARQLRLTPDPLLTLSETASATLELDNLRRLPVAGEISLQPPAGWQAEQTCWQVADLTHGQEFSEAVRLQAASSTVGAAGGQIQWRGTLSDHNVRFTIIRLGDHNQKVRTVAGVGEDDHSLWSLHNGRMQWTITPDFHGGVVAWRDGDAPENHLLTAYPEAGMLDWMNPWYGGIRPLLRRHVEDHEGWPGRLHELTFSAEPITRVEAGLPWQGVRLAATVTHEKQRGLDISLNYLTLPGSNLLRLVFAVHNRTPVYRQAAPGYLLFFQPDGAPDSGVLHGAGLMRKRTQADNWAQTTRWAAVENPDTGRAIAVVAASGRKKIMLMDWGSYGGHFLVEDVTWLAPLATYEMELYIALTNSLAEAERYAALAGE